MKRRLQRALSRLSVLLSPLLGGAVVMACFVQPRPPEEILGDVRTLSEDGCEPDSNVGCHDGNACTRDSCTSLALCVYEPDDSLTPDDGQPCTVDTCSDGVVRHEPAAAGIPCGANGALQCDGKGACVGCGADASLCGPVTSCLSWACQGDACAPQPVPAGQPLPISEQNEGDCGEVQCDGDGGTVSVRADDPIPDPNAPCYQVECLVQGLSPRPAGAVCSGDCPFAQGGVATARVSVCNSEGQCVPDDFATCKIGYACDAGVCNTECSAETVQTGCIFGATCVDGKCVMQPGTLADCQAACDVAEALGCPVDPSGPSCEQACTAIVENAHSTCVELAQGYVSCRAAAGKTVSTCAEHRTVCAIEYELFLECAGTDVPDGPGCQPLPCTTGFDGCSCVAHCDDALVADHCAANEDGTFSCTCARDGVTIATCPATASGCGIEKGCCATVL